MALNYNGTSPTAIKYNGTDLTVLKYGTTAVWGKPYTLTITKDSYTTVTVTRTSSPNQHASTGTLSSGSVVYYGDVLQITATPTSGYKINTFTVNGTNWTSGSTITVTSAINIVANSVVASSWKTVWSGSMRVSPTNGNNNISGFSNILTGLSNSNTRITLAQIYVESSYHEDYYTIGTLYTVPLGSYLIDGSTPGTWSVSSSLTNNRLYIRPTSVTNNSISFSVLKSDSRGETLISYVVMKIEQYY